MLWITGNHMVGVKRNQKDNHRFGGAPPKKKEREPILEANQILEDPLHLAHSAVSCVSGENHRFPWSQKTESGLFTKP